MPQEAVCTVTVATEQEDRSLKHGESTYVLMLQSVQCKIAMRSHVSTLFFFFSLTALHFHIKVLLLPHRSVSLCLFFFFFYLPTGLLCVHKRDAFQQITRSLNSDLIFNRSLRSLQWISGPLMSYICLTCTISFCWSELISDTLWSSISLWYWANLCLLKYLEDCPRLITKYLI